MRATVFVQLKPGVLDVEGKAIEGALHGLGFAGVSGVRVGKTVAFDLESRDRDGAEAEVRRMAEQLLANPVIENWRVEFSG